MPKRTASALSLEGKHEHWLKKSAIVAIIAAVITFLGGLNLLTYSAGHITPLGSSLSSAPFWIALITLFVISTLVDFVKSSLKKAYWIENIVGSVFGAIGYAVVFAVAGVLTFSTIVGFVFGALMLMVLFYVGFMAGHTLDIMAKEYKMEIN